MPSRAGQLCRNAAYFAGLVRAISMIRAAASLVGTGLRGICEESRQHCSLPCECRGGLGRDRTFCEQKSLKLSRAARASHFSFGKRNQNRVRRTLAGTMKPPRYPALLVESGPTRTQPSMASDMRAFPTPPTAMLGSLYGTRAEKRSSMHRRIALCQLRIGQYNLAASKLHFTTLAGPSCCPRPLCSGGWRRTDRQGGAHDVPFFVGVWMRHRKIPSAHAYL